ncbi:hypothetical protein M758_6G097000 [Ceratodon purpureus]|nr:hypothetical protein M758_6G097000 [Ceratodon purpureus]
MCKRKHNDLLRIVRNTQKLKPRECQTKAFGRILHHSQRRPIIRNKHLSSKFDRRCELDLLPDAKCREICSRTACLENSWVVPEEGRTHLSDVVNSEDHIRASFERVKEHGLRVLTRSKDRNVDERCHMRHSDSRPIAKFLSTRTAEMGAQMIHRELGSRSTSPDLGLQERDHDPELGTSPMRSPDAIHPKQGNISCDDYPSVCPTTSTPEEDSDTRRSRDRTNSEFSKDRNVKSANKHSHNHNMEPVEEAIGNKNAGSQTQTPTMLDPHDHLHDDPLSGYSSAPEDVVRQKVPTHTKAEDLPQAVWQKIMDLSGKVDSCFCSLDNKIAHSFNSLDEKLEMKFKYLDEGVTNTRETLQDKLSVLEYRIVQLERTTQISPMSFQSQVTYSDDSHPIRDITNTFNTIDNRSVQGSSGLLSEPVSTTGLLAANTQDFIANVRARYHQTKEMLYHK